MSLCDICVWSQAHCRAREVRLVNDAELDSDAFRRDVRAFIGGLHVPPHRALDFISETFRDSDCAVVIGDAGPIPFELDALEFDNFPYWWRDLGRVPPEGVTTRIRAERREAFRVLATILRLLFPVESRDWGKGGLPYVRWQGRWETLH